MDEGDWHLLAYPGLGCCLLEMAGVGSGCQCSVGEVLAWEGICERHRWARGRGWGNVLIGAVSIVFA